MDKIRNLTLEDHVGFDSLPDQLVNKAQQKGFIFNILCIGETGIGKSTLMNSLFNTDFESVPSHHNLTSVELESKVYELQESNVQMKLTIVDTIGYGDQMNKLDNFQPIVNFVDEQFEAYFQEELKTKRCLHIYQDTRIHACLYFICPTGHGLKSIDWVCMKKLDDKLNIIPIIAKADSVSKPELQKLKKQIMSELKSHDVKIYQFPTEDENVSEINSSMNAHLPFAVVGSNDSVRVGNKTVRGRQYPWGTVQVENEAHCDFIKLREMLIRTNMEDLREQTQTKHYELYRRTRLQQLGFSDVDSDNKPLTFHQTCDKNLSLLRQELQKNEENMQQYFLQRVEEKDSEYKDAEKKLKIKLGERNNQYFKEMEQMEDMKKALDNEMAEFQRLKMQFYTKTLPRAGTSSRSLSMGTLGLGKGGRKKSS